MKRTLLLTLFILTTSAYIQAQFGWSLCTAPGNLGRVDDIFMLNTRTGYAVSGSGKILKTTDGATWQTLLYRPGTYFRSTEFVSEQVGFVGGFPNSNFDSVLLVTRDGGASWTNLTQSIAPAARKGICGLAAPNANTIYGCGNWYDESPYIIKSTNGGVSWSFIDMSAYATSVIDMHFLNSDTGFAVGRGENPDRTAIILYTTDGGQNWVYKFKNTVISEYCWKIYRLNTQTYFASIEDDQPTQPAKILKSTDGGNTWSIKAVSSRTQTFLQGVGFLTPDLGWTGGHTDSTLESNDGGLTWKRIVPCRGLNRFFRVNDTLAYGSGNGIWRLSRQPSGQSQSTDDPIFASFTFSPNPANSRLNIQLKLKRPTHSYMALLNSEGRVVLIIDNEDRPEGLYDFTVPAWKLSTGVYFLLMRTHEDQQAERVIFTR